MGPKKNTIEQVSAIDAKIDQLRKQKEDLLAREKERSKRERTQRLIRNGELAEEYLQFQEWHPDDFEIALKLLVEADQIKETLVSINIERILEFKKSNGIANTQPEYNQPADNQPADNHPDNNHPDDHYSNHNYLNENHLEENHPQENHPEDNYPGDNQHQNNGHGNAYSPQTEFTFSELYRED
ncbi:MAG: hypothetical protein FWG40_04385 [Peptococcaceae bacterium]|nr:hypothetical protein [Peptococcaceae bacterium]